MTDYKKTKRKEVKRAGRIKGITIELDGDSTGLQKALSKLDKSITSTRGELKDINKLLKFNPDNVTLLTQKQDLLSKAIDDTTERLKQLQKAQKVADTTGDLGAEQYRLLEREIVETSSKLELLKSQSEETSKKLKNVSTNVKNTSASLQQFGKNAQTAGDKLDGVSKGATALITAITATVPATQELRRDFSNLEQNAKQTGVSMEDTTTAFKTFNAVSGETDSSVEAVSNLLQAGFTKSNLQQAVEGLSGAYSRFPDTLKIESLADSLQETLATGTATGQFGELLDRLGIGAENFSNKLAQCKTQAEKQNLALQTLADAGLNDSYKGWVENNKELVDYENSTIDLQLALSELAKSVAPIVSDFAELATKGINAFNKLPKPIKSVSLALTGITAVSSPVLKGIGNITDVIGKLKTKSDESNTAISSFSGLLSKIPTPVTVAVTSLAALAGGLKLAYDATNENLISAKDFIKEQENQITAMQTSQATLDLYAQKVEQLAGIENKSSMQKEQLKNYIELLNGSIEGLNLKYDEEADKLNMTVDAIKNKIQAQKEQLEAEAYLKQASAYADEYYANQQKITQAEANRAVAIQQRNALLKKGDSLTKEEQNTLRELNTEISGYNAEIGDLTNAQNELTPSMVAANNALAMQDGTFEQLAKTAKEKGVEIPENLKNGFEAGTYAIPASVDELKALITFDDLVTKAGVSGQDTVTSLQTQLLNGEITIDQAIQTLNASMGTELSKGRTISKQAGTETGQGYASGLSSQKQNTQNAGKAVAQSGKSGASSVSYKSVGTGAGGQIKGGINSASSSVSAAAKKLMSDSKKKSEKEDWKPVGKGIVTGTRKGIVDNQATAISSAVSMASSALAKAKKALGINSPSKEFVKIGKYVDEGFANGIIKNIPLVEKASQKLANASLVDTKSILADNTNLLKTNEVVKQKITQTIDYGEIYNAMNTAVQNTTFKIVLNNRELGRGLRGIGVEFQ